MWQPVFSPFLVCGWLKAKSYPYGHGKIEFISAGLEGAMIIVAGLFVIGKAIYNFVNLQQIHNLKIVLVLSAITGVVIISWVMSCKNGKKNSILF
jgi:divalent metal cation (Fe/Co/Zn/Cd) transporter